MKNEVKMGYEKNKFHFLVSSILNKHKSLI